MLRLLRAPAAEVSLVIALGLALAFVAAAGLTLAKFSEALSDAVGARYEIHAADLRSNIETGLNLGLEIGEIAGNVEVAVRYRLALDEGIERIVVTAQDGTQVFAMSRSDTGPSEAAGDAALAQRSLAIENSFGAIVGDVTVVYDSGADGRTIRDAALTLLRDMAVLAVVTAAFSTLWCLIVMAPLPRAIRQAQLLLEAEDPASIPVDQERSRGPEVAAREAAVASHEALAEIARIEESLAAEAMRRAT